MRLSLAFTASALLSLYVSVQAAEVKGMSPRSAPTDYQAHAAAGNLTIGAESSGHSIPVPEGALTTEEYLTIEVAIFGPADAKTTVARQNFSLRINGKKNSIESQPYELVYKSLKDPEWQPPETEDKKSKSSFGTGGQNVESKPPPPKMPIALQNAIQQRVQQHSLPEGERQLPQAGLIFFPYRGKTQNIRSMELIYEGPSGKATLDLLP